MKLLTTDHNGNELLRDLMAPFEFEVLYFRLKIQNASATGWSPDGSAACVLENGVERLSPRMDVFSGDHATWVAPTICQVKALLFQFSTLKSVYSSFDVTKRTTEAWRTKGVDRFLLWRQLLALAGVPAEPLKIPPLREIPFWDSYSEVP